MDAQPLLPLDLSARPLRPIPEGSNPGKVVVECAGCHVLALPFLYRTFQVQGHTITEDPYCLDCAAELILAKKRAEGYVPECWAWAIAWALS